MTEEQNDRMDAATASLGFNLDQLSVEIRGEMADLAGQIAGGGHSNPRIEASIQRVNELAASIADQVSVLRSDPVNPVSAPVPQPGSTNADGSVIGDDGTSIDPPISPHVEDGSFDTGASGQAGSIDNASTGQAGTLEDVETGTTRHAGTDIGALAQDDANTPPRAADIGSHTNADTIATPAEQSVGGLATPKEAPLLDPAPSSDLPTTR